MVYQRRPLGPVQKRVLRALESGPASASEDRWGMPRTRVYAALSALRGRGLVVPVAWVGSRHVWQLTERGAEVAASLPNHTGTL